MNSLQRHEARYQRRRQKRLQKKENFLKQYDDIKIVANLNNLKKSAKEACKGVSFKPSVLRYENDWLYNITKAFVDISKGKDVRKGFIRFDINERGHLRHIQALYFSERVIQKTLVQNVLLPVYTRNLIDNNGACLKGKGTLFSILNCEKDLREYYRRNNFSNDGYVLVFDFKSFFDSILHECIYEKNKRLFKDQKLLKLINGFISAFGEKGLGLGSEVSQITAVSYPNKIDHMITDQEGIRGYGRYMDDGYIISESKDFLKYLLNKIIELAKDLGLTLSKTKTQIRKLSQGFTFLKTRMILTETGKVLKIPDKKSITRQRRKLKKLKRFFDQGLMAEQEILNSYYSWLGCMWYKNSYKARKRMNELFIKLFPTFGKGVLKWIPKSILKKKRHQKREKKCMKSH